MKITKLAHSCLLVEMPAPVNRTVLFDPGAMSGQLVQAAKLEFLDDIVITHGHFDHFNMEIVTALAKQFPDVRILAPQPVVEQLAEAGVPASTEPPAGLQLVSAPHEALPAGEAPPAIGVHYLDSLTHPGDSHSITESKRILALPITAPWGSTTDAVRMALKLRPEVVIPVHDWMWKDSWRQQMYGSLAQMFQDEGIRFIAAADGKPFVIPTAGQPESEA